MGTICRLGVILYWFLRLRWKLARGSRVCLTCNESSCTCSAEDQSGCEEGAPTRELPGPMCCERALLVRLMSEYSAPPCLPAANRTPLLLCNAAESQLCRRRMYKKIDALKNLQFASCKQLVRSDRPARNRVLFGEVKHYIEGA